MRRYPLMLIGAGPRPTKATKIFHIQGRMIIQSTGESFMQKHHDRLVRLCCDLIPYKIPATPELIGLLYTQDAIPSLAGSSSPFTEAEDGRC